MSTTIAVSSSAITDSFAGVRASMARIQVHARAISEDRLARVAAAREVRASKHSGAVKLSPNEVGLYLIEAYDRGTGNWERASRNSDLFTALGISRLWDNCGAITRICAAA